MAIKQLNLSYGKITMCPNHDASRQPFLQSQKTQHDHSKSSLASFKRLQPHVSTHSSLLGVME